MAPAGSGGGLSRLVRRVWSISMSSFPLRWRLVFWLAVAVTLVALAKGWPLLHPRASERAPLAAGCDLRAGPCTVQFARGGQVTLAVTPRALPTLQPLTFSVWLSDLPTPRQVELDLVGVDMNMGFNRFPLVADAGGRAAAVPKPGAELDSKLAPGSDPDPPVPPASLAYQGTGMLPICVRERMTWEARVLLDLPDGLLLAPFRFETARGASPAAARE